MVKVSVGFANVMMVALVAGTVFGIWLGYDPAGLSPGAYVEQQQHAIAALNVTMPVLGAIAILLTLVSAALAKAQTPRTLRLLLGVLACLVAAGLVTRFGNQPINAIVMTWSVTAPPPDWTQLRDTWWHWHIVRTTAMVAALGLILLADPMRRSG